MVGLLSIVHYHSDAIHYFIPPGQYVVYFRHMVDITGFDQFQIIVHVKNSGMPYTAVAVSTAAKEPPLVMLECSSQDIFVREIDCGSMLDQAVIQDLTNVKSGRHRGRYV